MKTRSPCLIATAILMLCLLSLSQARPNQAARSNAKAVIAVTTDPSTPPAATTTPPETLIVTIQASPQVLMLDSAGQGNSFTIHAEISYASVADDGLLMNGTLEPEATFPDDRGELVARFSLQEVKAMFSEESGFVAITLTGYTTKDVPFSGKDMILVQGKEGPQGPGSNTPATGKK